MINLNRKIEILKEMIEQLTVKKEILEKETEDKKEELSCSDYAFNLGITSGYQLSINFLENQILIIRNLSN